MEEGANAPRAPPCQRAGNSRYRGIALYDNGARILFTKLPHTSPDRSPSISVSTTISLIELF
jgi:hypothetical protein